MPGNIRHGFTRVGDIMGMVTIAWNLLLGMDSRGLGIFWKWLQWPGIYSLAWIHEGFGKFLPLFGCTGDLGTQDGGDVRGVWGCHWEVKEQQLGRGASGDVRRLGDHHRKDRRGAR